MATMKASASLPLVLLAIAACTTTAPDAELASADVKGETAEDVIVFFRGNADLAPAAGLASREARGRFVYDALVEHAHTSQAGVVKLLEAARIRYQSFHVVSAIKVTAASAELIATLKAQPGVSRVVADTPTRKLALPELSAEDESGVEAVGDNLSATGADRVWAEGTTGEGVVIAGQDTGYTWDHPALKRAYRGWDGSTADHSYSWHDSIRTGTNTPCGVNTTAPCDDDDHGTHTMGTMVGDDGADNKIGMAPGARWIGCRNMNKGVGKPSTYMECFEWFLAPYPQGKDPQVDGKPEMAPHVINNSWGCDGSEGCSGTEMVQLVKNVEAAGIMVVVSAGNDGSSCGTITTQPATISDATLSVGAYNHRTGAIASFSSRGPSKLDGNVGPDVTAPGVSIRSSVKNGTYQSSFWSGTSMAGPHVAGEVALLWSAVPSLRGNIAATTEIIERSAKPTTSTQSCGGVSGSTIPNNTFGWGVIDAYAAVQAGRSRSQ